MIALPLMLVGPAEEAGIPVPPDPDNYIDEEFPQFHLFLCAQLGRPMITPDCHWSNAEIIAQINPEDCKTTTADQLLEKGWK